MSVMLLDEEMIGFITAAAFKLSSGYGFTYTAHDGACRSVADSGQLTVARLLWAENVAAYTGRYSYALGDGEGWGDIEPQHLKPWAPVPMAAVFKALDCYEYQAGEAAGWNESEAAAIVARVRKLAGQALPDYDDALWGEVPAAYMKGAEV